MSEVVIDSSKLLIEKTLLSDKFINFISKGISEKWNHKSKKGKKIILELYDNNEKFNKFMQSHIFETLFFKTIDGKSKSIFIDDIFIESDLIDGSNKKKTILDILEISKNNVICIEGIAGHGKSTLLRKILSEAINLEFKMPLFIELRKINEKNSIIDEIVRIFDFSDIKADSESVVAALSSGRFLLLLDGFDEVNSVLEKKVYEEIEFLKLSVKTPMVITSRPNTSICNNQTITNLTLKDLTGSKVFELIKKRMEKDDFEKAKNTLENNDKLLESLITPILVSLFCACYPETDYIPVTASDYYDRVFNILYEGHDKRKLYYDREKKIKLSADCALNVFTAFSFLCFANSKLSFNKLFAKDKIGRSLTKHGIENTEVEQLNYLDDLVRVTGLIKSDGFDRYTYIHRSILEYHAAKYILESDSKKKIYQNKVLEKLIDSDSKYISIAEFLLDKDEESTIKNIAIPLYEVVDAHLNDASKISKKLIEVTISDARVTMLFYKGVREKEKLKRKKFKIKETGIYITKIQNVNEISNSLNIFIKKDSNKLHQITKDIQSVLIKDKECSSMIVNKSKVKDAERIDIDLVLDDSNSLKVIDLINEQKLEHKVSIKLSDTARKINENYLYLTNKLKLMTSNDSDFDL